MWRGLPLGSNTLGRFVTRSLGWPFSFPACESCPSVMGDGNGGPSLVLYVAADRRKVLDPAQWNQAWVPLKSEGGDALARQPPQMASSPLLTLYRVTFTTFGIAKSITEGLLREWTVGQWRYYGTLDVGNMYVTNELFCVTSAVGDQDPSFVFYVAAASGDGLVPETWGHDYVPLKREPGDALARDVPVALAEVALTLYRVTFTPQGIAQSVSDQTLWSCGWGKWRYKGPLTVGETHKGPIGLLCRTAPVGEDDPCFVFYVAAYAQDVLLPEQWGQNWVPLKRKAADALVWTAAATAFRNALSIYEVTFTPAGMARCVAAGNLVQGDWGEWRDFRALTMGPGGGGTVHVCVTTAWVMSTATGLDVQTR